MNDQYFVCHTCKNYIEAGYRWGYQKLEHPGVIKLMEPVNVEAVFQANEYWERPVSEHEVNTKRRFLSQVRAFLEKHRAHHLTYETAESFLWTGDEWEWMDEEEWQNADLSPRAFVEKLGFTDWEQVAVYLENEKEVRGYAPDSLWDCWDSSTHNSPNRQTTREIIRRKFETLVLHTEAEHRAQSQKE